MMKWSLVVVSIKECGRMRMLFTSRGDKGISRQAVLDIDVYYVVKG